MHRENFLPLIVLAACLLLAFVGDKFFLQPIQREILTMQLETRRIKAIERELDEERQRHENFSDYLALTEEKLSAARESLPEEPATDRFVSELYSAADANKILLSSVNFGEVYAIEVDEKKSARINRQTVNVKVEGDYISTLNFVREILDGERFVGLGNFSIDGGEKIFLLSDFEFFIYSATDFPK